MSHQVLTTTDRAATETARLATAFAATLTEAQRAQLLLPYRPATISNWSNYPQAVLGRRGRTGLPTATLNAQQWTLLDALLAAATGSAPDTGVDRIRQHLDADDHLLTCGGRHGYGRGNFVLAFLGTPGLTGTWELQFGGHHLAVARTYTDGRLTGATPSFRGIEPFHAFTLNGVRSDPERRTRETLTALLASLDATQTRVARLRGRHHDLTLGPGRDWAFPTRRDGLPGTRLTGDQRRLLRDAIAAFVADVDDDNAARILQDYTKRLDDTYLGWSGGTTLTDIGDYVRIDGPAVWIELSMHEGIVLPGPHPHAVWRDRATDYGGTRF